MQVLDGGIALCASIPPKWVLRILGAHPKRSGCVLALMGGVSLYFRWKLRDPNYAQVIRSKIIDCLSKKVDFDFRSEFRAAVINPVNPHFRSSHSHPTAAAIRTNCNQTLDDYVLRTGRNVYSVSMSAADERAGHKGNRYYWHHKDLAYDFRDDKLSQSDVIKMSDTGYYLDLPDYMHGHELVLYEIDPVRAASSTADASYRFDEEGCLVEMVQGDAKYRHALWNLHTDHVLVRTWLGAWVYLVEKILHPEHPNYRMIGLFPRRFVWNPAAWLLEFPKLERRKVVNNGWAVIDSLHNDSRNYGVFYTSIAKVGDSHDAFLPKEVLTTIISRLGVVKHLELGGIEAFLEFEMKDTRYVTWQETKQSVKTMATVIMEYFKAGSPRAFDKLSAPRTDVFTPINKHYRPLTDAPKPTMRSVLPPGLAPIIGGGVCPSKSAASEFAAVQGRISNVRNDVKPPGRFIGYAREFVRIVVPDRLMHTGVPVDIDEVFRRQSRPTQVSLLQRCLDWWRGQRMINKFFVKREAYGKINNPRVISTMSETFKCEYSSYLYSLTDNIVKRQPWYAFGRTPNELVEYISARAMRANTAIASDFSFYDGTISMFLREYVEAPILLRYFEPKHGRVVVELHASQCDSPGVGTFGTKAPTGPYRRSGSPETSAHNSLDAAFIAYCAMREAKVSPSDAYANLGLYGGDDGVSFDLDPAILERTAEKLGMSLKTETLNRGDPIPFLGRVWFNAWTGDTTSIADVPRQAQKLHLTTQADTVSVADVLRSKADGLALTDARTPILGVWALRVKALTTPSKLGQEEWSWFAQQGAIFKQPDEDTCYSFTAKNWNIDSAAIDLAEKHILNARTLDELFPTTPFHQPGTAPKIAAIMGGEIHKPPPSAKGKKNALKQY